MSAAFETVRLTPAIGAEVHGLDLSDGLDEETADVLYATLLEHHVLVLRGGPLAPDEMEALGASFGPIAPAHHTYPGLAGHPSITVLDTGPDQPPDNAEWHTDLSFRPDRPFLSILQPSVLPPTGGDTLFASLFAVHDALLPGLRSDLEGLTAMHDMGSFRNHTWADGGMPLVNERHAEVGASAHPVVDHHPVTGRPFLHVNESFTTHVLGMPAADGWRLLTYLFDTIARPQFQVRVRWEPDVVVLWDNRTTQHVALNDYGGQRRELNRTTVTGPAPVG